MISEETQTFYDKQKEEEEHFDQLKEKYPYSINLRGKLHRFKKECRLLDDTFTRKQAFLIQYNVLGNHFMFAKKEYLDLYCLLNHD